MSEVKTVTVSVSEAPIQEVTVYTDRAEIKRLVTAEVDAGTVDLIIEGITLFADQQSIRIGGGVGQGTILEVSDKVSYHDKNPNQKEKEKDLQEQIKNKNQDIQDLKNQSSRLLKKLQFLDNTAANIEKTKLHTAFGEKFLGDDHISQTFKFMENYALELEKHDSSMKEIQESIAGIQLEVKTLQSEYNQSVSVVGSNCRDITVGLNIMEKCKIQLDLSYIVTNCSWIPSYDCRVDGESQQMELSYFGNITNSTGEDWENVQIHLSTAKPAVSGSLPILPTATVTFQSQSYPSRSRGAYSNSSYGGMGLDDGMEEMMVQSMAFAPGGMPESAPVSRMSVLQTTATESTTSATFTIQRLATIMSDKKEHKLTIAICELKARFSYSVVPKMSESVYLKASTENTTEFLFLAGSMAVFIDNTFIANSKIKDTMSKEEFAVFLGTDSSIKCSYKPIDKHIEVSGMLSKVNIENVNRLISVKNNKDKEIALAVYDQLPKSSTDKIKVTLQEPNLANISKKFEEVKLDSKNNLQWRARIKPQAKLDIHCSYSIQYPINEKIDINLGI